MYSIGNLLYLVKERLAQNQKRTLYLAFLHGKTKRSLLISNEYNLMSSLAPEYWWS
jgi:hypothetical protein